MAKKEEEVEDEVESIIAKRIINGELKYRVKWKNYDSSENTWEPEENLHGCRDMLHHFQKQHKKKEKQQKSATPTPSESSVDEVVTAPAAKRSPIKQPGKAIASPRRQRSPSTSASPEPRFRTKRRNRSPSVSISPEPNKLSTPPKQQRKKHNRQAKTPTQMNGSNTRAPVWADAERIVGASDIGSEGLNFLVQWRNGRKDSWQSNNVCRDHIPLLLLDFYEENVRFE